MTVYTVRFPYPKPPLSLNQRLHHMAKAVLTAQIRRDTAALASDIPFLGRCEVALTWYVNDRRRRDDENPIPTMKAMCDELVTLGVVEDDTRQFMVKQMPSIVWIPKATATAHMLLTITGPLTEAEEVAA